MVNDIISSRLENRLLIVSHNAFSYHLNNGKTLTALFSHRKDSEVCQLYFQDELPETSKKHEFYRLRDIDILKKIFLFRSKAGSSIRPIQNDHSTVPSTFNAKPWAINFIKKFNRTKKYFRNIIYSPWLGGLKEADLWVESIKPTAILLVGSDYSFLYKIATRYAKHFKIPLYVYLMDDFLLNFHSKNIFDVLNNRNLFIQTLSALEISAANFVISDEMAYAYSTYFKKDFEVLSNCVDLEKAPTPKSLVVKDEYIFVYAGGLSIGRFDMLIKFKSLLDIWAVKFGVKAKMFFYSNDHIDELQTKQINECKLSFGGHLSKQELFTKLNTADFLLHVESDKAENIQRTKLSLSTKLPEYLSTGRCVIGYGPSEVASMKLLSHNNVGIFVHSRDSNAENIPLLSSVILSPDMYKIITSSACDFVLKKFNLACHRRVVDHKIFQELI